MPDGTTSAAPAATTDATVNTGAPAAATTTIADTAAVAATAAAATTTQPSAEEKAAADAKATSDKAAADAKAIADKATTDKTAADAKTASDKAAADKLAADEKAATDRVHGQLQQTINATKTKWADAAKVDKEYGGEKFEANLAGAKEAMTTFFAPDFIKFLDESGLGNHPEMIRGLYRIRQQFGADGKIVLNDSTKLNQAARSDNERLANALYAPTTGAAK